MAAGHPGQFRTLELVNQKYYWKSLKKLVNSYVSNCKSCIRNKHSRDVTQVPAKGLPRAFPTRFPPFRHPQKRQGRGIAMEQLPGRGYPPGTQGMGEQGGIGEWMTTNVIQSSLYMAH
ncbi:Transposon Tf2-1 polyprotein [Ceratobasidium sp. AG-Ba]|nr:Transposon Tf2-1 polyprotein [Ceratobasidium sp. AG-Ba]